MTGNGVALVVVTHINHDKKITSTDGFINNPFCFTGSKARNACIDDEAFLRVAAKRWVTPVFGSVFLTLDTAAAGSPPEASGHALFVTLAWVAATLALGVAAAAPLARTVRAAARTAP